MAPLDVRTCLGRQRTKKKKRRIKSSIRSLTFILIRNVAKRALVQELLVKGQMREGLDLRDGAVNWLVLYASTVYKVGTHYSILP